MENLPYAGHGVNWQKFKVEKSQNTCKLYLQYNLISLISKKFYWLLLYKQIPSLSSNFLRKTIMYIYGYMQICIHNLLWLISNL